MKKAIITICSAVLFLCLMIFTADLINITQYIPFTKDYDWLVFSGIIIAVLSLLTGFCCIAKRRR